VAKAVEQSIPVTLILVWESGQVGRQVFVEIEIPKREGWLKMSASPSVEGLPAQQILTNVARVVQPPIQARVKFQLALKVWGYEGPSA